MELAVSICTLLFVCLCVVDVVVVVVVVVVVFPFASTCPTTDTDASANHVSLKLFQGLILLQSSSFSIFLPRSATKFQRVLYFTNQK